MNKINVFINPKFNTSAVQYVFRTFAIQQGIYINFSEDASKNSEAPCIFYGIEPSNQQDKLCLILPFSDFFLPDTYFKLVSLPIGNGQYADIPCFLFQAKLKSKPVPDPVAHIFFCLTLYEDLIFSGERDHRHRKKFVTSYFHSSNDYLEAPTVDHIFEHWVKQLKMKYQNFSTEKIKWGNKQYCLSISRDIDSLHSVKSFKVSELIKSIYRGNVYKYYMSLPAFFNRQNDPHDNLEEILEWEKKNYLRSSFNFLASEQHGDANYTLYSVFNKNKHLRDSVQEGWEIGFHPGTYAWQDHSEFKKQLNNLKNYHTDIKGGRQHGLRFSNPHTWRLWEENNLLYDSSVGFAEMEGFRAGTCFPYQVFDLLENKTLKLIEIPITIMDCTMDKYRKLDIKSIENVFIELRKKVQHLNGVFSILWHNTYFITHESNPYSLFLQKFTIESTDQALCMTHGQISMCWKERIDKYSV